MAKGYWVVHLDLPDPEAEAYKAYRAFVGPYLEANEGRFVTRGGQQEVTEGSVKARTVVVEFPSYEAARRAYHTAEYGEGVELRMAVSSADFAIVEGV